MRMTRWTSGRTLDVAIGVAFLLLAGAGSLWLGPDATYDLHHYHFYGGYALLTGRLDHDILPGGLRNFFNPTMDVLHYWGMRHWPPRTFAFLLGALHGLNLVVVHRIARVVFAQPGREERGPALVAALLAASGPNAIMPLGTSSGDLLSTTPMLLGLMLVLEPGDGGEQSRGRTLLRALLAGVLAGAAVGLKLTALSVAVALSVAFLVVMPAPGPLAAFGLGGVTGFLLTAGYWTWLLSTRFGSPVFPLANKYFHSPLVDDPWMADHRWEAHSLGDWLRPPFDMLAGNTARLQEVGFRDARVFVLLIAATAWLGRLLAARWGGAPPRGLRPPEKALLAFVATAYVVWLKLFYYGRYLVAVELLAPVALYVLLRATLPAPSRLRPAPVFVATALALVLWARFDPRSWGRGVTWQDGWFRVQVPDLGRQPNTVVLMDAVAAAFVIPYFPPETRFFNLQHGISHHFSERIAQELSHHQGPLLYLRALGSRDRLAELGLRPTGECADLGLGAGSRLRLCPVEGDGTPFDPARFDAPSKLEVDERARRGRGQQDDSGGY
jgi:hypothetical protein